MLQTNYQPVAAAFVLAGLGYTNELFRCLTNEPPPVRWSCAKALAGRQDWLKTNNLREYAELSNFREQALSKATTSRIGLIFDEATIWVLIAYLETGSDVVRAQAADELSTFGVKAYPAVPFLKVAISDRSESVRHNAAEAISKIDVQFQDGGVARGPRKTKRIALEFTGHSFAEGANTILDELAKHQAKASFFLTGDFLRNPEFKPLIERIINEGHYIGPHSDKHLLFCRWDVPTTTLISQKEFESDLTINRDQLRRFARKRVWVNYWLPAYEHYNQQIADWSRGQGFTLVNFTPGTRSNADYTQESDTNFVSSQAIFDSIVKKEREDPDGLNGFLLLMHLGAGPGRKDKMHARFGELLDYLTARGYTFVRIDEMLGAAEEN